MNINQFKKGDVITRTEPASRSRDRSYMGDKMTFISIENNQILLLNKGYLFNNKRKLYLNIDLWSEGWDYLHPKDNVNIYTKDEIMNIIEHNHIKTIEQLLNKL